MILTFYQVIEVGYLIKTNHSEVKGFSTFSVNKLYQNNFRVTIQYILRLWISKYLGYYGNGSLMHQLNLH